MTLTKEDIAELTKIFEKVVRAMEGDLINRMEGAAKGIIRQEINDRLYSELHNTIREVVKREVSVSVTMVEGIPNGPMGAGA